MIRALLFCILFQSVISKAQIIEGQVLDANSGEPIAYTSIKVTGGMVTTADSLGRFQINQPEIKDLENFIFSRVGYKEKWIDKSELLSGKPVFLKGISLKEVLVLPNGKRKSVGLGRTKLLASIELKSKEMLTDEIVEFGKVFRFRKPTKIENVSFYVSKNSFERVKFRLNIYEFQKESSPKLIDMPLITTVLDAEQNGWIKIETEHKGFLEGKYLISFQLLEASPSKGKWELPVRVSGFDPIFYYEDETDSWRKGPIQIPFKLDVFIPD